MPRHRKPDFLTTAQQFYMDIILPPVVVDYKAPHAPRGTPPRKHWKRSIAKKLFTGHRP